MSGEAVELALYRFRTTWPRRWPGYLSLVLMVGLLGGLAMGSVAAARKTDSSFRIFLDSTNYSELDGVTWVLNPQAGLSGYDPAVANAIRRLPLVKKVESQAGLDVMPLAPDGAMRDIPGYFSPGPGNGYGSIDGAFFDIDRLAVLKGRMAVPSHRDEVVLSAEAARALGVGVGGTVRFGVYTNSQALSPTFGRGRAVPREVVRMRVVGIDLANSQVITDDVDKGTTAGNILFTPAFTKSLLRCCVNYAVSGAQVEGGAANVAKVAAEISRALPKGFPPFQDDIATTLSKGQRALKPEAIALGVFGGIIALAGLLVGAQLAGRQLRLAADERAVLRALGAGPGQVAVGGLLGSLASIVVGSVVAVVIAVAMSPLAPLGPVRPVYPYPGVSFDWVVLGSGLLIFITLLSASALATSFYRAPHREERRDAWSASPPSRALALAAISGLPAPALMGVRFAVQPGGGRSAVPVRSAVLGAVLAVLVMVGTVTFGASLNSLVDHPAMYGWNWDYILVAGGDLPGPETAALLGHDHYVAAWSGIYTANLAMDGMPVPVLAEAPGATVTPPLLSGHGLRAADQVVLGSVTLSELHKRVGSTVVVTSGVLPPARLRVVGTATMPTLGSSSGGAHLEMGTGALLADQQIPPIDRNPFGDPVPGPNAALVRLKPGVDRAAALKSLHRIAAETSNSANFGVGVLGVLRPAEISNYRSMSATPAYLGAGLAAGAVAALALTLFTSVRRRRRDLSLLKSLGFTNRQLRAAVAWHATVSVGTGVALGVPLGIAVGRWLWDLFARDINVVPSPTVPVVQVALIAAGALLLGNAAAALPGRLAARTPAALVLRSE